MSRSGASAAKGSTGLASEPAVSGRTWEIRPSLFVELPTDEDAASAMQQSLRDQGLGAWLGWMADETGIKAVSGTVVVDADGPVAALDIVLRHFIAAARAEGLTPRGWHDVVIQPAWRDERSWDWRLDGDA